MREPRNNGASALRRLSAVAAAVSGGPALPPGVVAHTATRASRTARLHDEDSGGAAGATAAITRPSARAASASTQVTSGPLDIELLSAWYCPYAQRAWIALEEKAHGSYTLTNAQEIAQDEVSYVKSPRLLQTNPEGLVPTILDRRFGGERVVAESLVCIEYVDESVRAPDGAMLLPGDAFDRAHARRWIDFGNRKIVPEFYHMLVRREAAERDAAGTALLSALRAFSGAIVGPFFLGERFSAVDIAVAPWVVGRLFLLEHYRGWTVPDTPDFAAFHRWRAAVVARPSFASTIAPQCRLVFAYKRYADGTAQSQVGTAIRAGKTL